MTYDEFENLHVGDMVKCINDEGWNCFTEGEEYEVTCIWIMRYGFDLKANGEFVPVAAQFREDFEKVKR